MVREVRGIYSEVGRRGVSGNGVIVERGKGYSEVGRRGVNGIGVIVVLEVREVWGIVQ